MSETPNKDFRNKLETDQGKNFFKFVDNLDDKDRERFLSSLTEQEIVDYSGSREEFRMVIGREPEIAWPDSKPTFEEDVHSPVTNPEELRKRFNKMDIQFPQNIKNKLSPPKEEPKMNLSIMINMVNPKQTSPISLATIKDRSNGRPDNTAIIRRTANQVNFKKTKDKIYPKIKRIEG